MKRLISTINLSKEEWLRYRKCGITGTDAGAILGLNPYRSAFQVYHDKISDTIENIDSEAMRQGRDLEKYVAQRFTEATGLKVRRANAIYQNEEHPLLLADFDRLIVGQKAGLECKTVSPFSADKWADGKIPAHYMAQVNHYLAVSGFDCWYIAALIFGKELVIHKIISDKAVLDNLIAEEEHFWKYNVMPEIAPTPTGSEGDTQQINQMYFDDDKSKTADLNAVRDLLDKRQSLSDQIEQLEQEKTAIEQQVKLEMQDAAYGTAPGYKVSWVSSESKRSLVYKGRKVALYGGAYAPSYLPNDVDTFTCGVNCGNHQIRHPPLIVKVHFFPCVQIAGNFFDLFQADGIHTQLRYLFDKLLLASVQFFNLAVHIGEQDGICPGQRVNERFNFVLDLCEFYLQGGQLWIGLHRIFSPLDGLERF